MKLNPITPTNDSDDVCKINLYGINNQDSLNNSHSRIKLISKRLLNVFLNDRNFMSMLTLYEPSNRPLLC